MLVLMISASMTEAGKEVDPKPGEKSEHQRILYIDYSPHIHDFLINALIGLSSKINQIQPSFWRELGFHICKTDINTQKIDGSRLET